MIKLSHQIRLHEQDELLPQMTNDISKLHADMQNALNRIQEILYAFSVKDIVTNPSKLEKITTLLDKLESVASDKESELMDQDRDAEAEKFARIQHSANLLWHLAFDLAKVGSDAADRHL